MDNLWDIFVNKGTVKAYLDYKARERAGPAANGGGKDGNIQGQGNRPSRVRGGGEQ
jgi:hypothetical protein